MSTSELPVRHPPAHDVQPDDASGYGWLVRVWVLVVMFALVAMARSSHVGIPFRDVHGEIFRSRIAVSLGLFAVLAVIDASLRVGRRRWTVSRTVTALRERWTRRRLVSAMGGLLAYHLVYFCYHNLKSWDAFNQVRDTMLLRWDHWLFFGHDPAVLLHQLLGQHVAAYVLMVVYESFSSIITVSFVASMVFPRRIRDGYVFIASAMWVWILGLGSYYLIPSLGSFHAAPQNFAGLPHTMIQDTQAQYMAERAHLLAHPHATDSFQQVSAFASLHIGVTTVVLLMAAYYRLRRLTIAMVVFLFGTILATVYLGWHFAVDDVAGLAIGWLAVFLGRRMIYPRGRPSPPSGEPGRS
ncbi:MAG: phosphatase PAP2 family protein [Marmoricola sp.]